ncbi:RIP metalloprotease RseP [Lihuaxuella thermophila]|uniref:Zinc metalloprotease n=1 Tax=Lihuaxuella thermophila TaxID=1173111 RepID=A0A1H8JDV0_9BACL|nr:RIP metalloprotease RseP [Lihuaxuella thermophila]SEN78909.1 regulator of sigma E protease [Lihuaxuella thermophila]
MQTVLVFILVLSLLVFIHELGHFLFAKRAGILVREFAIGFGPKIYSRIHGETMYSIRALPLGGFVRMAGEDAEVVEIKTGSFVYATQNDKGQIDHLYFKEPVHLQKKLTAGRVLEADLEDKLYLILEDDNGVETKYPLDPKAFIHFSEKNVVQIAPKDRQFGSKTVGQKAMAIFAGPLFNIILTIILFMVYTLMVGVQDRLPVEEVLPGKPAAAAGIQKGDLITAVNGEEVRTMDALRYKLMESKGQPVTITVQRAGETLHMTMTPEKVGETYQIGAKFSVAKMMRKATVTEAIADGFKKTYEWSAIILDGFAKLVTGQLSIKSLGGPVQMGDITGKAAEAGIAPLIKWTALLSLNLGIFNLLPIPALDGSRLVFIGLEAVRGRPINPNKESLVHFVGFALLMMLMLVVTFNDIKKIFFT